MRLALAEIAPVFLDRERSAARPWLTLELDARVVLEERHNFDPAGHYARPDVRASRSTAGASAAPSGATAEHLLARGGARKPKEPAGASV